MRSDLQAVETVPAPSRPYLGTGLAVAATVCVLDQLAKLWMIFVFDLGEKGIVKLSPLLDLVLVWNTGISYGLFQQESDFGRWMLLGFKACAVALLLAWLVRSHSRLTALALGLIIGGALGNSIDRLTYGAVADFALFHVFSAWKFPYVFNVADASIVAGVIGLLYDSLWGSAAKAP